MSIEQSICRIVHVFLQHLLHLSCVGNKALSSDGNFEGNIDNPTLQICEKLIIFTKHTLHLSYTWTCRFLPSVGRHQRRANVGRVK